MTDFAYTSRRLCQVKELSRNSGHKTGGRGNHRCDVGNTVVSSIIPFPLVFALKKHLAGQKFHGNEVVKNEVTT
jgi:hypothetical protein